MTQDQNPADDGLYRRLLAEGTPADEIDQVYRKLRDKGYGEEAARARVEREMHRIRQRNRLEERRHAQRRAEEGSAGSAGGDRGASVEALRRDTDSSSSPSRRQNRRSQDWFPVVSPDLRRRVNRWAHRNRLLAVGIRERVNDFLTLFRADVPDYVSPRLLRYLARPSTARSGNPYEYSLRETLEALRAASGTFLARPGHEETSRAVSEALRRRDPLAAEYLETFFEISRETRTALRYLELNLQRGRRVTAGELARVAREVFRISLRTQRVSPSKTAEIFVLARDVALAYRAAPAARLDDAEAVLRIAIDNLSRFRTELYPIALKGVGRFYELADTSEDKWAALLDFASLRPEEVLDPGTFYEAETKRRETELAEKQKRELEWLEMEKSEEFSSRFAGILGVLSVLFPNSGLDNLERMPYLLPYFDANVYAQRLPFSHHMQNIESVAASDPAQPLLVLHRIVDDLAGSIRPQALETLTGRDGIADRLRDTLGGWQAVYAELFDRYLRALTNYRKGMEDSARAHDFRSSAMARSLEEEINQLRNLLIRDYGHVLGPAAGTGIRGPRVYELAGELQNELTEIAEDLNQDLLTRTDPLGKRLYEGLGKEDVVDLETHGTRSPEARPAARQVKRYIEAKYGTEPARLPRLSQLFFFDVLRGVADMYAYLTNDESSFLRAAGERVVLPGEAEADAWKQERESPGSSTEKRLQIRLTEQLEAEYTDGLTGLKNKTFFIRELPKAFEEAQRRERETALIMLDIDHFKWINDNLGHQKGDTILQDVARSISENSRGTHDRAVRYGGEEFILFVQASLHSAVLLAERLRHLQEKRVSESELYEPVRGVQEEKGAACGTFSIGVVAGGSHESLDEAVEHADRALYRAKERRNSVVMEHDSVNHDLMSYEQYLRTVRTQE
ncbi:MAG: GGDEF domain-containing protein [Spirochaetia bacterium]